MHCIGRAQAAAEELFTALYIWHGHKYEPGKGWAHSFMHVKTHSPSRSLTSTAASSSWCYPAVSWCYPTIIQQHDLKGTVCALPDTAFFVQPLHFVCTFCVKGKTLCGGKSKQTLHANSNKHKNLALGRTDAGSCAWTTHLSIIVTKKHRPRREAWEYTCTVPWSYGLRAVSIGKHEDMLYNVDNKSETSTHLKCVGL